MHNVKVNFKLDGSPYQGILHTDRESFYLDVEKPFTRISYEPRRIVCFSGSQVFVLYRNRIYSERILPSYIVIGYEMPCFNCFEFCLGGLQDFLVSSEMHDGFVFGEYVKINDDKFFCECFNDRKKTTIRIKTYCQWIEISKIESIVRSFVQLFSLLSYKRITCSSIRIVDGEKRFDVLSWTFDSFHGDKSRHKSLLIASEIIQKGLWKDILCNYFENDKVFFDGERTSIFKNCLNGFISQIDSDLFWDYKALGVCGIWDRCSKLLVPKKRKSNLETEEDSSLYERFCTLYDSFDEDLQRLFPKAKDDINRLKEIRNCVAHGEIWDTSHKLFEVYYQAFRRMRLLAIVYIYLKFGIPLVVICEGLRSSYHGCVANAQLDSFVLSSVIGDTPSFRVNEKTWKYFAQVRVYSCLLYNPYEGLLSIDEKTTQESWRESLKGGLSFYGDYISRANPVYKNPAYQNHFFIHYGDECNELYGMFILNYEDLPESIRHVCELQRTDRLLRISKE